MGDPLHVLGVPAPGFVGQYRVRWPLLAAATTGLLRATFVEHQRLRWRDPPRYDVVVWNRVHNPEVEHIVRQARAMSDTVSVWDTDDLELLIPHTNPVRAAYRSEGRRTAAHLSILGAMRACDAITTSVPALAEHLRWFNERVVVLPNQIDPQPWTGVVPVAHDRPYLLFCGSNTHADSLRVAVPGVQAALRRHRDWQLVLLGFTEAVRLFDADLRARIVPVPWERDDEETGGYRRWLAAADLVFRPSLDRAFERCKSENPVLEAGAVRYTTRGEGVAIVASAPTYGATLQAAGLAGCVVPAPDAWESVLDHWMDDAADRRQAGRRLGEYVAEHRTYARHARAWASLYERLCV